MNLRCIGSFVTIAFILLVTACSKKDSHSSSRFSDQSAVLTEELRIDGHDHFLTSIPTVAVRTDGTMAVAQPQERLIRVFSAEGELLGTFGRSGQGPGEFSYPVHLGWRADTLWVYDNGRLTLALDLTLVRTTAVRSQVPPRPFVNGVARHPDLTDPSIFALLPDGSMISLVAEGESLAIGRIEADGSLRNRLLTIPTEEGALVLLPGGVAVPPPFMNLPRYGSSRDGSLSAVVVASVRGEKVGTFDLWGVNESGDTLFANTYRFDSEAITKAVADSAIQEASTQLHTAANAEAAIRRAGEVPEVYPPIAALRVGGDNTVWIQQRTRAEVQAHYVVGVDGSPIGTLEMPRAQRLVAAERNRIWVVEVDPLGVESLVRYRVAWQERGAPQ